MTIKQLEQKIAELERRIAVLENTRPIVYPQPYTGPYHQPQPNVPSLPNQPQHPTITWC